MRYVEERYVMTEQEYREADLQDFAEFFGVEVHKDGKGICKLCNRGLEGESYIVVDDDIYCHDCFLSMSFEKFADEFWLAICEPWTEEDYREHEADLLCS